MTALLPLFWYACTIARAPCKVVRMEEATDIALLRQRMERVESDVARNSGRLDAVVRLEERLVNVQDDVHDLTTNVRAIADAREHEREVEADRMREHRRQEQEDRKQDRRTLLGIAGGLFIAIVIFILGIAQAGILH